MENLSFEQWLAIAVVIIWSVPWKAAALWRSARRGHLGWFLVLIVFNTLAILDILYLFVFSNWGIKKKQEEKIEKKEKQSAAPQSTPPPSSTNKPMIV